MFTARYGLGLIYNSGNVLIRDSAYIWTDVDRTALQFVDKKCKVLAMMSSNLLLVHSDVSASSCCRWAPRHEKWNEGTGTVW